VSTFFGLFGGNNNVELVKLLIEYALQHQISLEYDKKYKKYIDYRPKIKKKLLEI